MEQLVGARSMFCQETQEPKEGNDKNWPHNLHISTNYVLQMQKVFSIVRQRCGLSPTEGHDDFKKSCREYILPRNEETSRVRGWIRGNTKIGPVLDVKVCCHQGRHGAEIMIEFLFRDQLLRFVS